MQVLILMAEENSACQRFRGKLGRLVADGMNSMVLVGEVQEGFLAINVHKLMLRVRSVLYTAISAF